MKEVRFYKYAALILFVLNIALLAILTFGIVNRPPPPGMRGEYFREKAINILNLDEGQQKQFKESADKHLTKIRSISGKQKQFIETYFGSLYNDSITTTADDLPIEMQKLEAEKIKYTYQHLEEVQAILRADQQEAFETFVNELVGMIMNNPKKNKKDRRK